MWTPVKCDVSCCRRTATIEVQFTDDGPWHPYCDHHGQTGGCVHWPTATGVRRPDTHKEISYL
jgi:hypothetical protein